MTKRRQRNNAQFKFQVALKAVGGLQTIRQLASDHSVHPESGQPVEEAAAGGRPNGVHQWQDPATTGSSRSRIVRADRATEGGPWVAEKAARYSWGQTRDNRDCAAGDQRSTPMRVDQVEPVDLLLSAGDGVATQPAPAASDRSPVHWGAVLWLPQDDPARAPIGVPSSQHMPSPPVCKRRAAGSAWTAAAGRWTTSSWSGSGIQ